MKKYFIFCCSFRGGLVILLTALHINAAYAALNVPFDPVAQKNKLSLSVSKDPAYKFKCEDIETPVKDFVSTSKYDQSDKTRSHIDPENEKKFEAKAKPLRNFVKYVTKLANLNLRSKKVNSNLTQCLLTHLNTWATAKAMMGERNHTGFFESASMLSSVSIAYLKTFTPEYLKTASENDKKQLDTIKNWIHDQAESIASHFDHYKAKNSTHNNHRYWGAFGVGMASLVTQEKSEFDWAMSGYDVGINEIQKDGFLPLELSRGGRANSYHVFATGPLVWLAALGSHNGVSTYSGKSEKIHKLLDLLSKIASDSSYLKKFKSDLPNQESLKCRDFAFLEIYNSERKRLKSNAEIKFADSAEALLKKERTECDNDFNSSGLGGNLTELFQTGP